MKRNRIKYQKKVEQSSPPEIEMRQEEAPIVVFQDGEKAIGRIHQIVDEIYAALGALQLVSADIYYLIISFQQFLSLKKHIPVKVP